MALLTAYLIGGQPIGKVVTSYNESYLNGNPPFKSESTVSSGYEDISSISYWDMFGQYTGKDTKFIKKQIKDLRVSIGYANLSLNEKIISNKYFASGVEYSNAEVTIAQQNEYYIDFYKPGMNDSRTNRDNAVSNYLIQKLYTGILSKTSVDSLIKEAMALRTEYIRDGLEGIGYGDADDRVGIINFVNNSSIYSGFAIINVDVALKNFKVIGNKVGLILDGSKIRVYLSTGNDAIYTVVGSGFDGTNTTIKVSEAINSSIVDGNIYYNGLFFNYGLTTEMRDVILDIYLNGNY